jgi:hypothetical protein
LQSLSEITYFSPFTELTYNKEKSVRGATKMINQPTARFLQEKVSEAKVHFERALNCKHTEFDDLYPYMMEHPQFFWYKRYVAWSELLTIVKLCEQLQVAWQEQFTPQQGEYIQRGVMSAKVLDYWFETNDSKEYVGG